MASASYSKTLGKAFQQFQVSTKLLTECIIFLHVVCEKSVNHRSSIKCNLCQTMSHLKCNDLNYVDGLYLKNLNISWYCRACCADIFPFTNINNYKLYFSLKNTEKKYYETYQNETCLVLKPQKNLNDLFNEFNNFSDQNKMFQTASTMINELFLWYG